MRKPILAICLVLITSTAHAESIFQLNRLYSGFSHIDENKNSSGQLIIKDDGTIIRTIARFSSSTPEVTEQAITSINGNDVFLEDTTTREKSDERILLATQNRIILIKGEFLSEMIIEDWTIGQPNSSGVVSDYRLKELLLATRGLIVPGEQSVGNLTIASDGKSLLRNLTECDSLSGCSFPRSEDFNIAITPDGKLLFENKETRSVTEHLMIAVERDNIILLEISPSGGGTITSWVPANQ